MAIPKIPGAKIRQRITRLIHDGIGPAGAIRLTHYGKTWAFLVAPEYGEALDLARDKGSAAGALRLLMGIAETCDDQQMEDVIAEMRRGDYGKLLANLAQGPKL